MASEEERMLNQQFKQAIEKRSYFLLAATGSAIGFALTQTKTEALDWQHLPLGFAIIFWSYSFYCGIQFTQKNTESIANNIYKIKDIKNFKHSDVEDKIKNHHAEKFNKIETLLIHFNSWQVKGLLYGGSCYVLNHIWKMVLLIK